MNRVAISAGVIFTALLLPRGSEAANVTVNPGYVSFNQVLLGQTSAEQTLKVVNGTELPVTLGTGAVDGPAAAEFVVGSDQCSGRTLAAGAACAVKLRFTPASSGAKAATWSIDISGGENGTVSAFLANYADTAFEARRRVPPVLVDANLPALRAGTAGEIRWELEGYDPGYQSMVVLFDCQGMSSDCGASYTDANRIASSGLLTATATVAGSWSYEGETTQRSSFRYTFTPEAARFASGGEVVARFYYKSADDADLNSLSLLLPGGMPDVSYYDSAGRRIALTVSP